MASYTENSYIQDSFVDPMNAQDAFANHLDLNDPSAAASSYAKYVFSLSISHSYPCRLPNQGGMKAHSYKHLTDTLSQ